MARRQHQTMGGVCLDLRSVLVFPGGMPSCLRWARHASDAGIRVVGASSLAHDPARANYAEWTLLPWIGDSGFTDALDCCIREHRIDTIFTSHPVIWRTLREAGKVRLEARDPWAADLADYRDYREIAARFQRQPLELAAARGPAPAMPLQQLAALVRQFQLIPGQCDHPKLEALTAIFRWMPKGDIVEIGSLWGRSAVALAFLGRHYGIGSLLCVDPWRTEELRQGIPAVDADSAQAPMDEIFEAFCMNLAPFQGVVNYSRTRSSVAAERYSSERSFTTRDFGSTLYRGEIALLHIDGNHALDAVREDISLWRRFVCAGGWVVFDDYRWPFGNGPKTAADEFSGGLEPDPAAAFVAGGALFLQIATGAR